MNIPLPELSRTKIWTGTLPSPFLKTKAALHPFTQQLDVLFSSSPELERAFLSLETQFYKGTIGLAEIYEHLSVRSLPSNEQGPIYLCTSPTDDKWCIDPRGILTLSMAKDTYERLGLLGNKLPFKGAPCGEQYTIRIPLDEKTESVGIRAKRKDALMNWDRRREEEGFGKWEYVYAYGISSSLSDADNQVVRDVKPQRRTSASVHIPVPSISSRPSSADDIEDWNVYITALFEWVGMASLGAQRLDANDSVDPYVAVYSPPTPSRIGTLTHIRWTGLLSPVFVQNVIDAALNQNHSELGHFISITSHACTTSPVTYIPATSTPGKEPPARLPRSDAEDTWSLFLVPEEPAAEIVEGRNNPAGVPTVAGRWALVDSIGKWDTRWG